MASKHMPARSPRHITSDCYTRPLLNAPLLQMIESILQVRQHNSIELAISNMNYEVVRQFTFATYPRKGKPDIRQFIIAGFYYTGYGDEVVCYCCNLTESGWAENDIPTKTHIRQSPNCDFYSRNSEVNVPFFDLMGEERSFPQEHTQMLQTPVQYTSEDFQPRGTSSAQTPTVLTGSKHATDDNPSTQMLSTRHNVRRKAFVRSQMVQRQCKSLSSLKYSGGETMAKTQATFSHHLDLKDSRQCRRLEFNAPMNTSTRKVKNNFRVLAADREAQSRDPGAEMYMCKICLDSTARVEFLLCAHLACCSPCSYYTDVCPECKQEIETKINVSNVRSKRQENV
ncbi:baculoviral IAP repeat-containing protein 3-like isoform X1 [Mercenaria mercenaria]|uniref:baculoviral IAP repeat-containing protein 3-like isoform X1 n=1 Tax=Mercenaria mercenaria TaxID=6596 RepID=UPI00234F9CF3|nr:baculoviral IAP repeat-containing protein 3-like isoform X1 [Mercenaria mercenaria]XP_053403842.1 baculoviral IAP repeat-containing protein 3-like isoform X1 [Mercenaria mercenaria]